MDYGRKEEECAAVKAYGLDN